MAKKKKQQKEIVDPLAALGVDGGKSKSSKKKSDHPVLALKQQPLIKEWLKAEQEEKKAKADKSRIGKSLVELAEPRRIDLSRSSGKNQTSVILDGVLRMTVKNQYSKIKVEDYEDLKETFGDRVSEFFTRHQEVKVKDNVMKDPKALKKLMDLIGAKNFNEYFEVSDHYLKPTAVFDDLYNTSEDIYKKSQSLVQEGVISRYSPTLKGA